MFSAERFLCLSINKRFRDRPPQQILSEIRQEKQNALEKDKKLKTTIKWSLSSASSLSDYLEQYEEVNNRQPHYIIKNGPKVYVLPQEDLE